MRIFYIWRYCNLNCLGIYTYVYTSLTGVNGQFLCPAVPLTVNAQISCHCHMIGLGPDRLCCQRFYCLYCTVMYRAQLKHVFFIYKSGCVWPQSVASARLVNQQKFSIFAKFYFLYCENVRKHEFCHYAKINMFGKCAKIYIRPVSKPAWVVKPYGESQYKYSP